MITIHQHTLVPPPGFEVDDSAPICFLHPRVADPEAFLFLTVHPPTHDTPQDWVAGHTLDGPILEACFSGDRAVVRLAKLRRVIVFVAGPFGRLPIALHAPDDRFDAILDALAASVDASRFDPSAVWID